MIGAGMVDNICYGESCMFVLMCKENLGSWMTCLDGTENVVFSVRAPIVIVRY